MKKISKQKIAEIYAKALIDAEKTPVEARILMEQAKSLADFLEKNFNVAEYFSSPLFSIQDKQNTLSAFCKEQKFLPIMNNFLQILLENSRFSQINQILSEFIKLYMENCGFVYVNVQSAKELSKKQDNDLQKNLKKLLSKDVIVKYEIKPEILGGLVIQYEDNIIDDSLQNKLSIIEKAMKGA